MSIECFWSFPSVWASQTESKTVYDPLWNNFTITLHSHWKWSKTNRTFWMGMAHPIWCNVTHWKYREKYTMQLHSRICKASSYSHREMQQALAQPELTFSYALRYGNVTLFSSKGCMIFCWAFCIMLMKLQLELELKQLLQRYESRGRGKKGEK